MVGLLVVGLMVVGVEDKGLLVVEMVVGRFEGVMVGNFVKG